MNAPVTSNIALQWTPLSFAQQRLWFFSRLESGSSAYNIGGLLRFDGALDLDSLRHGLDQVYSRHAALRTVFREQDGLAQQADRQVFGENGKDALVPDLRASVGQLNALLAETRNSLKKVDAVLVEAQAIGANTREATTDLGALRADVESNLRKVESLVNEIQRKWPFARDTEIRLP